MNKKITGTVKNGKFKPDSPNDFKYSFAPHEGKDIEIVVKRKSKNKNRQYKYLYSTVYQLIANQCGCSTDQIDYAMKLKFHFDFNDTLGVRVPKGKSDKLFGTKEFTQYIDNIRMWAMDFLGVRIPEPNEIDLEC